MESAVAGRGRVVTWHRQMQDDLTWYLEHDNETGRRAVDLIEATIADPFNGRGKPKPLGGLANVWTRRVTIVHRLNYIITGDEIRFISCRGHDMPQHLYAALRLGEWV